MNFKPLILVAALTLAAGAHAAPKAKATKARANKTPVVSATTMPAVQSGVHLSDGIAAVVDNEVITHRQVEQAVAQARQTMPKGTQMDANELRQQVLAQMINQSLILQAGKRRNIQATDSEIEAVIAHNPNIKNPSAAVRQDIADSIIVEKVRQQAIMQNSRVSDSEVARYIEQAKQQGVTLPEADPVRQYHAQHILIKADNDNAAVGAESTIRKIYSQARSGADFGGLARQYSQDGSAGNGGDLGWFADGMMVAPFEEAVHKLKPGQISAPVRTQFGWHIINGHVPVHVANGENPIKANGKLMVIDGGFSQAYHKETGIAGYTLVFHSRGFQLVQHEPFTSAADAVLRGTDIKSTIQIVEMSSHRMLVADTDKGAELKKQIADLEELLYAYRHGIISEQEQKK